MNKMIPLDELPKILKEWSKVYLMYVPKKLKDRTDFSLWESPGKLALDYRITRNSVKSLFFSRSHDFLDKSQALDPNKLWLIFGVHPCDVRSLSILDKVFDGPEYESAAYVNRRKNSVVVSLFCNDPLKTCFCTTLGGSPHKDEGADCSAVKLSSGYLLKALTEKGERLMNDLDTYEDAAEENLREAEQLAEKASESIEKAFELDGLGEILKENASVWDDTTVKCVGCGECTYICPTCHCFDIIEKSGEKLDDHVKNWRLCMLPLLMDSPSGEKPSPKVRVSHRLFHKYSFFLNKFQETSCVGCGRCIVICPAHMDIRKLISELRQKASENNQTGKTSGDIK